MLVATAVNILNDITIVTEVTTAMIDALAFGLELRGKCTLIFFVC